MRNTETITLRINKNRYRSFLRILKNFDFISVETPEDFLKRYIRTSPVNIPLSDKEISDEVMKSRWMK